MNEAVRGRLSRRVGRFFPLGKWLAVPFAMIIGAGWWLSGCKDDPTEPFMCGVEIGVQKGKVQNCNLPDQVCICETHSCAQKVAKSTCRSGYQYVGEPYLTDRAQAEVDLGSGGGSAGKGGAGGGTGGGAGGGMAGASGGSGGADSKDEKLVVYAADRLCVPESYVAKRVEWNADDRICKGEERGTGGAGGTGGSSTSSSGETGGGGMGSTSSTSGSTGGSGTGGMTTGGGTSTGSAGAGGTGGMP